MFAIYAPEMDVARLTFFALFALQHRGQESAGIAVTDGSRLIVHKDMGLVSQVFEEETLQSLPGTAGHRPRALLHHRVERDAECAALRPDARTGLS